MHWKILDGATETADHWRWRPGWRPGRRMVTMHLTVPHAPELHALSREVGPVLAGLGAFDPVPVHGLHLTMTGVGFTDELATGQAEQVWDEVVDGLGDLDVAPLLLDRVAIGTEAVMLCPPPTPWLEELCTLQREAVDRMRGHGEERPTFHPHLSLAYAHSVVALPEVAAAVAPLLERTPPLTVQRPMLTMMRLGRDTHEYAWEVLAERPLESS